jgi:hypothetical protein
MSNRIFDSGFLIKRRQDQVYARNLYLNNTTGQRLIYNPQNTNGNASMYNLYDSGAQTEYYRSLRGGETVSVGGIVNIPPTPQVNSPIQISTPAPEPAPAPDLTQTPPPILTAPILTYGLYSDSGTYLYFTKGDGDISGYEYTITNGEDAISIDAIININQDNLTSPLFINGLLDIDSPISISLRAVNGNVVSDWSVPITILPTEDSLFPTLYYDPNIPYSYNTGSDTVNSIGSVTNISGTKGSNVSYQRDTAIDRNIFDFNGANGNANLITFPQYNFGTKISVTAWIFPRAKSNINGLLVNTIANVPSNGFKFQWNSWLTNNQKITFQAGNGARGEDNKTIGNIIEYNKWQHIGYVFDQENKIVIFFKNGVPVKMETNLTTVEDINTNQQFNIGGYRNGSYTMNAKLGYIKVFDRLLNGNNMMTDYDNTKSEFGLGDNTIII